LSWAGFSPSPANPTAPPLGRDTYAVLHSIGISNKQIADCIQAGIAYQPEPPAKK
jgi:hypothetical protein